SKSFYLEKKAQEERKLYIDVVEKSVKDIIKDESTIMESLENVVLAKSSSQPQSTYEAAASLRTRQDGKAYSLKRSHEDKDKDEDPLVGPNQGLKKKKTSKAAKPLSDFKSKESKSRSSKGSKSLSKSSGKSAQSEEPVFETTNPEGHQYPFDLSKPLPLIEVQVRQVVPADYFINNDLEYLKGGSLSKKYTTSATKTKAAKYDNIEGIEDMVQTHMKSTHDVYSRKRIIAVTHVKVMKTYDYGYLEEIEVRRDDNTLHKFKEGDFLNLNLRDIEDMLLLLVQKKISNLERDVIFDLNVALQIFTRSIVILKRVKDLQLGVKSYQKKLNITKPETFKSDISKLTPYTTYKNPQGIIYQDKHKRNRLMRSDELYKFCDGTLTYVRRVLHDIASSLEMDYLPKRTWSKLDRKRPRIMIKAIDQQLFERRLMRNLEKFVRGREYRNDFRMLEQTI
ncbi:hypothetical protein Tco_1426241, partial [Tanacetum coccineum]